MKPLVSIIINNYNYARFLGDAVDSALQQTYANKEIIVVDDGSTDHSLEVLASYGNQIFSLLKTNKGQASCFNVGFHICKGDVILFLDADDYLQENAVEKAVELFEGNMIAKVHWRLNRVNEDGKVIGKSLPDSNLAEGDLKKQLIQYGPSQCGGPPHAPPTSGNAWSRHYLEKILPMPEDVFRGGADGYLFALAPLFGEIKKINETLGFYRIHGSNNTVKSGYIHNYFARFEECCKGLSKHLAIQGIDIDPKSWPRDHWYHKVNAAMNVVKEKVDEGSSFILIDDSHWVTEKDFYGRTRIPFMEKHGYYAGPPESDIEAIREIEKQKHLGAGYVVLPWSCYWYLDQFTEFAGYLSKHYPVIVQNELVKIYAL